MALVQAQDAGKKPSPGLALDFPSNNPFRNRAASPASFNSLPSPQSLDFNIQSAPAERPRSRNPFLDNPEQPDIFAPQPQHVVPQKPMMGEVSPVKGGLYSNTTELFHNLELTDNSESNATSQAPFAPSRPPRSENVPPPQKRFGPSLQHQQKSKEEEQQRLRTAGRPRGAPQTLDIFADPPAAGSRPRRNSDSSIADKSGKILSSDDERRRRERRHKDREARHRARDDKTRPPGGKKPSRKLDVIDQLDLTGVFGTGLMHHDGPFDACNPHRNRKGSQRAPMKAFAKDSLNNTIGGSGPVNKDLDLERFHGRGDEGFTDFSTSGDANPVTKPVAFEPYAGASAPIRYGPGVRAGVDRTSSFNATDKVEPIYGDETLGLGASTFLEGAPAAKSAINRRESESDNAAPSGGLGRKKSLIQKIRGTTRGERTAGPRSPESYDRVPTSPGSPPGQVLSAGGTSRVRDEKKYPPTNPFFNNNNNHDEAYEKKGAKIQIAEERNRDDAGGVGRERAISSPKRGPLPGPLERRVTHDGSAAPEEGKSGGGGFLSRVRSLKGGPRRGRPDRG